MKYDLLKEVEKHIESINEKAHLINKDMHIDGKKITMDSTLSRGPNSFFIEITYFGDNKLFGDIVSEWLDYVHYYMDDYYGDDAHTLLDINEWTSHIDIKIGFYFR